MVRFPMWTVYTINPPCPAWGDKQGQERGIQVGGGVDYLKRISMALRVSALSSFTCFNWGEWVRGTQCHNGEYAYNIGQLSGVWMFMLEQGIGTWEGNNKEVSRGIVHFFYLLTFPPPAGMMIRVTSWEKPTACFLGPKTTSPQH